MKKEATGVQPAAQGLRARRRGGAKHANRILKPTRRDVLAYGAGSIAAATLSAPAVAQSDAPIKVGFVSPQTGPLAAFGEADGFVVEGIRKALSGGVDIGGRVRQIEILVRDSQSNPNRAADIASDLILGDEVSLILASSTGATVNPVADIAELNEIPCVTTDAPWEAYFFGRGGDPAVGFEWTYHFFWGLGDLLGVFTDLWDMAETNRSVGALFSNDIEGIALADPNTGFPRPIAEAGYDLTLPALATPLADDYTSFIADFANADCQILTGAVSPPDFATFWVQAAQQGLRPQLRFATIAKAMLFPAAAEALGDDALGVSTEVWWTPKHPFSSGLTGQSSAEFAASYTEATGRQWTQPLGFKHALLEVAIDVLKRSADPQDPRAVREAIIATDYESLVGRVSWSGNGGPVPVRNVCTTPLVGGQWRRGGDFAFDLAIVNNNRASNIPTTGDLVILNS